MNTKKLLILVSIAVIAILAIVLNEKLSSKEPSEQSLKFFDDKIGSFVIKDSAGTVTLRKKGDVWVASNGVNGTENQGHKEGSTQAVTCFRRFPNR